MSSTLVRTRHYSLANGERRTTCGAHRTVGFHVTAANSWLCRECGERASLHETGTETIARKKKGR